jgi:hypothetical protein
MKTATYLNQHYRVLSENDNMVTLLSVTDEVIEVVKEQITIFNKVVKRSILKRKRVNMKRILAKAEAKLVPVEVKDFDSYLAEQKRAFLGSK